MWEIWTFGELPYGDKTGREVLESIDKGDRLDCPPKCPQLIYKAMRSCWECVFFPVLSSFPRLSISAGKIDSVCLDSSL